ncbi:hypothetical protein PsYK624_075590 [Phanerochaete sordida]|uniref:Uncharacterized protein n=1 Tax=Phanerochaete sordida TaxID=48140 RepID=A0A9P3GBN8_9APHY|nr:hypothetical protein PsYK624_075590 [Phanerochaete sordida]
MAPYELRTRKSERKQQSPSATKKPSKASVKASVKKGGKNAQRKKGATATTEASPDVELPATPQTKPIDVEKFERSCAPSPPTLAVHKISKVAPFPADGLDDMDMEDELQSGASPLSPTPFASTEAAPHQPSHPPTPFHESCSGLVPSSSSPVTYSTTPSDSPPRPIVVADTARNSASSNGPEPTQAAQPSNECATGPPLRLSESPSFHVPERSPPVTERDIFGGSSSSDDDVSGSAAHDSPAQPIVPNGDVNMDDVPAPPVDVGETDEERQLREIGEHYYKQFHQYYRAMGLTPPPKPSAEAMERIAKDEQYRIEWFAQLSDLTPQYDRLPDLSQRRWYKWKFNPAADVALGDEVNDAAMTETEREEKEHELKVLVETIKVLCGKYTELSDEIQGKLLPDVNEGLQRAHWYRRGTTQLGAEVKRLELWAAYWNSAMKSTWTTQEVWTRFPIWMKEKNGVWLELESDEERGSEDPDSADEAELRFAAADLAAGPSNASAASSSRSFSGVRPTARSPPPPSATFSDDEDEDADDGGKDSPTRVASPTSSAGSTFASSSDEDDDRPAPAGRTPASTRPPADGLIRRPRSHTPESTASHVSAAIGAVSNAPSVNERLKDLSEAARQYYYDLERQRGAQQTSATSAQPGPTQLSTTQPSAVRSPATPSPAHASPAPPSPAPVPSASRPPVPQAIAARSNVPPTADLQRAALRYAAARPVTSGPAAASPTSSLPSASRVGLNGHAQAIVTANPVAGGSSEQIAQATQNKAEHLARPSPPAYVHGTTGEKRGRNPKHPGVSKSQPELNPAPAKRRRVKYGSGSEASDEEPQLPRTMAARAPPTAFGMQPLAGRNGAAPVASPSVARPGARQQFNMPRTPTRTSSSRAGPSSMRTPPSASVVPKTEPHTPPHLVGSPSASMPPPSTVPRRIKPFTRTPTPSPQASSSRRSSVALVDRSYGRPYLAPRAKFEEEMRKAEAHFETMTGQNVHTFLRNPAACVNSTSSTYADEIQQLQIALQEYAERVQRGRRVMLAATAAAGPPPLTRQVPRDISLDSFQPPEAQQLAIAGPPSPPSSVDAHLKLEGSPPPPAILPPPSAEPLPRRILTREPSRVMVPLTVAHLPADIREAWLRGKPKTAGQPKKADQSEVERTEEELDAEESFDVERMLGDGGPSPPRAVHPLEVEANATMAPATDAASSATNARGDSTRAAEPFDEITAFLHAAAASLKEREREESERERDHKESEQDRTSPQQDSFRMKRLPYWENPNDKPPMEEGDTDLDGDTDVEDNGANPEPATPPASSQVAQPASPPTPEHVSKGKGKGRADGQPSGRFRMDAE